MSDVIVVDLPSVDVGRVLGVHQQGRFDQTTQGAPNEWWRATLTPDGPGTLHLRWGNGAVEAQAWGPGGDHLLTTVPALVGALDRPPVIEPAHPAVARALVNQRRHRLGWCGDLYHTILPVVLGQRVTTREAFRSWRQICRAAGERAPGPVDMWLPPRPEVLAGAPYWWFHRFGVERKRADALRLVGRHGERLAQLSKSGDAVEARRQLSLIPGIGQWTIGSLLGPAFGDPDAFAIGDFWLCHGICHALDGTPRGSDARMVELLEPYAGQRGRVVSLLGADGWHAQRMGPGIATLPIAQL